MRKDSEKPWFRSVKNAWYCWKDGKQFHSEKRDTALKSFYRKMAEEPKPKTEPQPKADKPTVKQVCDAFLSDTQSRVKANTHATYRGLLGGFTAACGEHDAETLTASAVYQYPESIM